jgi:hypothetical protein
MRFLLHFLGTVFLLLAVVICTIMLIWAAAVIVEQATHDCPNTPGYYVYCPPEK